MSERYRRLFTLPSNLYAYGAPVIIKAGALLLDGQTNQALAQLKFKSVSKSKIAVIKAEITPFDTAGRPLGTSFEHQYLDLNIEIDEEFGAKVPIPLPDATARSFSARVTEVIFANKDLWSAADNAPWEPLDPQSPLDLGSRELNKEYCLQYGKSCAFSFAKEKDLWFCPCGAINKGETCHKCGLSLSALETFDLGKLKSACDERLAKEKAAAEERAEKIRLEREQQAELARKKAEADRLERERKSEIARKEAARRAKRIKRIAIITSSTVAACVALVILWITVLSPMIQYIKAQTLLDNGSYDEAIAIFTELEQYRDSSEKVLETKYAKAENLFANKEYDASMAIFTELADYSDSADRVKEVNYTKAGALAGSGDYAQAADIYYELGEYKDSATLYPATVLNYATALVENKDLSNAEMQLRILATYDAYAENTNALYVRVVDTYYADGKFNEALSAYKNTKDYSEDSDKYKDMTYKYAQSLFDQKYYTPAKSTFRKVSGYLDADKKVIECDYQEGHYELSKKNYIAAIRAFERVKDYSDSKEQIKEAKYQYIKATKSRTDTTTYTYLKDLKADKYKDSADIFKELYAWKVTIIANDDEDGTTNMTSITKYSTWYFHVKLSGGEPGAKTKLKYIWTKPDGSTDTGTWDNEWSDGWSGWTSWSYETPMYGKEGTLKVKIYDGDGNLLGEHSVKITR